MTAVVVPETAPDIDDGSPFWQHDVGSAWEVAPMESESEPGGVQKAAYLLFRLGVTASYP